MGKVEENKNYSLIYIFMYLLYIIILLPKTVQMVVIFILFLYLLKKNKFKIWNDRTGFIFSLVGIIQIFAIILNLRNNSDNVRVAAALNTASLWVLGGMIYSYIKNSGLDRKKINKAMFINMLILIALSIFMLVCVKIQKYDVVMFSRHLMRKDWAYGVKAYRLRAFLLYDTLVPMLYFTIFPFFYEYVNEHKSNLYKFVFVTLSILPVYLSKSRMGTLLIIVLYIFIFSDLFSKNKRKKVFILSMLIFTGFIIGILNYQKIYDSVYDLIDSRSGSTSTRNLIYQTSINTVLDTSPLIGCGIKEMLGEYPLGSHSTYIGLLYKVGIIGLLIGLIALFKIFKEMIRMKKSYYIISAISLSLMFITEDLDGENWLIILFVILYGSVAYNVKNKIEMSE